MEDMILDGMFAADFRECVRNQKDLDSDGSDVYGTWLLGPTASLLAWFAWLGKENVSLAETLAERAYWLPTGVAGLCKIHFTKVWVAEEDE